MHLIIPAIITLIILLILSKKNVLHRKNDVSSRYPVYRPNSSVNVWETKLSGITYKCTRDDVGVVVFAVKPHEDDELAKESMVVIRDDGKVLGEIAEKELKTYNEWSHGEVCTGIGLINYDEVSNSLWCDMMILGPDVNDVETEGEFKKFLSWVDENYSSEYIPERYR